MDVWYHDTMKVQTMTIRLPDEQHEQLRRIAFDTHVSMNAVIVEAIAQHLRKQRPDELGETAETSAYLIARERLRNNAAAGGAPPSERDCPDCGVIPGAAHVEVCDVPTCPDSGLQRLVCGGMDGHKCPPVTWTGQYDN